MSLKEIAKQTGVSVSTVSRALSGHPRISEKVRVRIVEAARNIGYIEDRIKKAVHSGFSSLGFIAPTQLLSPSETNFVSWTIYEGLRRDCDQRGITMMPITCFGEKLSAREIAPMIRDSTAQAMVLFFDDNPSIIDILAQKQRPAIVVAGQDPTMRLPSVGIANRYAARLGAQHLLELGHRRIAVVTWGGRFTIRQREDGVREMLKENGINVDAQTVLRLDGFDPECARQSIHAALDDGGLDGITALFCLSDNIALGAMQAAAERGLNVPGDLSIIGFDDISAGEMAMPALTTIHAPFDEIGPAAIEELELQARSAKVPRIARRTELGCTLKVRGSCGPGPFD